MVTILPILFGIVENFVQNWFKIYVGHDMSQQLCFLKRDFGHRDLSYTFTMHENHKSAKLQSTFNFHLTLERNSAFWVSKQLILGPHVYWVQPRACFILYTVSKSLSTFASLERYSYLSSNDFSVEKYQVFIRYTNTLFIDSLTKAQKWKF